MSRSGVNLAVTKDGGAYNRLRRPDDYLESLAKPAPKEARPPSITESSKRKLDDAEISDSGLDGQSESKRPRDEDADSTPTASLKTLVPDPRRISRPVRDCGMQSMFPGLDDDDSADDSTQDALAYLRSVRSEASTIPRFIVAEPEIPEDEEDRSMYNDGRGDYRAYYDDGTWVAVDYEEDVAHSDEPWSEGDLDPQEEYYKSLTKRYNNLREMLANADPKGLAALVETDPAKYANLKLPSKRKAWLCTLQDEYPTPALVAQMQHTNLFKALEYCTELLDYHDTISKQQSCWIWTLLALVGDRGTLDYHRIGQLRELGQKAGRFGVELRSGRRAARRQEINEEVEEWDVDGNGVQSEESVYEPDDVAEGVQWPTDSADHAEAEASNTLSTQVDGTHDRPSPISSPSAKETSKYDAHPSPSFSEGEISEDSQPAPQPTTKTSITDLEAARARLLAQLGDRLVKPSVPPAPPSRQSGGSSGGRHRHNGKVCHNPNCHINKQRAEERKLKAEAMGRDAMREVENTPPPAKPLLSREEAEEQRRMLREEELRKLNPESSSNQLHSPEVTKTLTSEDPKSNVAVEQNEDESSSDFSETDYAPPSPPPVQVDLNTRVTIDMILTVVGECYGQRDLLEFREVW